MKIILIGIQGSGKSTQGKLLSKEFNLPYVSSGNIFRNMAKTDTRWGRYVKGIINKGMLIPDEKIVPIIQEYISRQKYKEGYILDGFPRTLRQARAFKSKIDVVFYLKVSDKEALWRIANRNDKSREDETVGAVKRRIDLFHQRTESILGYYKHKGILKVIDGEQSIEKIFKDIKKSIFKLRE